MENDTLLTEKIRERLKQLRYERDLTISQVLSGLKRSPRRFYMSVYVMNATMNGYYEENYGHLVTRYAKRVITPRGVRTFYYLRYDEDQKLRELCRANTDFSHIEKRGYNRAKEDVIPGDTVIQDYATVVEAEHALFELHEENMIKDSSAPLFFFSQEEAINHANQFMELL